MRTRTALAALLTAMTVAACSTPDGEPAAPVSSSAAPAPQSTVAPAFGPADYRKLALCTIDCATTGAIPFTHPRWGQTWLITFQGGGPMATEAHESGLLAAGQDGTVRWSWRGGDWTEIVPAEPATDSTGHLFVRYNPSRYDGLLVLAPAADGFEDFGSLPDETELPTSKFYSVTLVDTDSDGVFEIRADINNCDPNCADGTIETSVYRWTGTDYLPE